MAKHRLATMVDPLADDEVQLLVGCVQPGLAGEKRAGLGEVGHQPPTLAITPFADVSQRAPSSGQRPAEGFVEARRVHHLHHSDVVVQVLADAGQVVHHRVAVPLQVRPRADAPLPRGGLPRRPPSPGWGTVSKPQLMPWVLAINANSAGHRVNTLLSAPSVSSRPSRTVGFSLSRAASTQPANPPPITT